MKTFNEFLQESAKPVVYNSTTYRFNGEKLTRGDILFDDKKKYYAVDRVNGAMVNITPFKDVSQDKWNALVLDKRKTTSISLDKMDTEAYVKLYRFGKNIYMDY